MTFMTRCQADMYNTVGASIQGGVLAENITDILLLDVLLFVLYHSVYYVRLLASLG
jgi:hypothetical protein